MEINLEMINGTIRLNRQNITRDRMKSGNPHSLAMDAHVSYPTMRKYLVDNDELDNFSGRVLYAILHKGFGLAPSEIANMRLGDVFEVLGDKDGA